MALNAVVFEEANINSRWTDAQFSKLICYQPTTITGVQNPTRQRRKNYRRYRFVALVVSYSL